jgi:glutamine synthetase
MRIRGAAERLGVSEMRGAELVSLMYADISGLVRGRAFPLRNLEQRLMSGVGWVPANQVLTPVGPITAPNPWGPIGDLRLRPDPNTKARVELWEDASPLHFYLCDAVNPDGSDWDSCPRVLLKRALQRLREESGLRLLASLEQEFKLLGIPGDPAPGFSLELLRTVEPFGALVTAGLEQAGVRLDTFLPEYGANQFEVTYPPTEGLVAADVAVIIREIVREVARRLGYRATFAPVVDPEDVGSGLHIHLSFIDENGDPATYDPDCRGGMSERAAQFVAGIVTHLPGLCAFTAPSVVSYLRLGPHRSSSGFACAGEANREAAVRIPSASSMGGDSAARYNLEYRPADSAACPHLALTTVVLAGLSGIREKLVPPELVNRDPLELSEEERTRMGVRRLPRSLEDALAAAEADDEIRSWFHKDMWDCYFSVKHTEIEVLNYLKPEEQCQRYTGVY